MATLVLSALGSATPLGPVGGFIGAAIGGIIDQQILMPAIFGVPRIEGPRIGDLSVQTASEGSPMKWIMGPLNRTAGCVIFLSDLKEVETETQVGKGGGGSTAVNRSYFIDILIEVADCWKKPINRITKIWGDGKLIFDLDDPEIEIVSDTANAMEIGPNHRWDELTIYKGTATQDPDPLYESYRGVGNTPRLKKIAYVSIKNFALADFGLGRLPNLTFQVEAEQERSVASSIGSVIERAKLTVDEYDVTRVPGCLRGYTIAGPQDAGGVLDNVVLPYGVSFQESGGKLVFFAKGKEVVITVPEGDLAAREEGKDVVRLFKVNDCDTSKLPKEVAVTFIDAENDLQQATQTSHRINLDSKVVITANFPLTFLPKEAKNLAFRMAWTYESECPIYELTLPPSYITLEEGDALTFVSGGRTYTMRIDEVVRGSNFMVEVRGAATQAHLYAPIVAEVDPSGGGQTIYVPPVTKLHLLDLPALQDGQLEDVGLYYAVCALDPDAQWRGAFLYRSNDNLAFTQLASIPNEATIGYGLAPLPPGPSEYWDEGNTVDVELYHGALESVTEQDVLDGKNWAVLGGEIIAYQNAALVSGHRWRLSRLLRGLRNTEQYISTHTANDRFVRLSINTVGFSDLTLAEVGATRYYKAPSFGAAVSSAVAQSKQVTGNTLKPFAPCEITIARDGSNNVVLTWTRRSRALLSPFSVGMVPLLSGEDPETYEVDFINGGTNGPVLSTHSVTGVTTATFTAAQHGTAAAAALRVKIYQISTLVGRGNPGEATLG